MKTLFKWLLILAFLSLAGGALLWSYRSHHERPAVEEEVVPDGQEEKAPTHEVKLSAEAQGRAGLDFAHPSAAEFSPEITVFGQVLDPSPLAALVGELEVADAAFEASKTTVERERGLFAQQQNVSRKVLDASEAQYRADEARRRALNRRLLLEWGKSVADLDAADREALVDSLGQMESVLVRADVPPGKALSECPLSARIYLTGHDAEAIEAKTISPAVIVDPKIQGQSFLLNAPHPPLAMRSGAAVVARLTLPGEKEHGFLLPRSAVVRHEGKGWVYVKEGGDTFERREVSLEHPMGDGWFVASGYAAGDDLVVTGAQTVLSEELKGEMAED